MSKYIILILVVVILAGGVFVLRAGLFVPNKETISGSNEAPEKGIVKMTDDGFVPSEIKIKAGETIRFVNKGKYWHWPASDLHPTHTLYPEFDPRKPVGPGEEWAFTFEKIGEWGFHDHLSPYITGKVVVVEP